MNQKQQPITYRRFVYSFSMYTALGLGLFTYAVGALIVVVFGGFVPSIDELNAAGIHIAAMAAYGITLFCMVFYQNDRWLAAMRQPAKPERTPRPLASRNHQETQRLNSKMAMGRNQYFPVFSHHYAALYHRLERNKWKITKRVLKLKVDTVAVFPNIDAKYMDIVKEWNRLGFVDGYVAGEAREKWFLNEAGRRHFAEAGRVHNEPHPPTGSD